jgi:hypothetical protein
VKSKVKQATITLKGKSIVVKIEKSKVPSSRRVTSAYYTSSTTAMLSQSAATGYDIFEESHYIMDRLTTLVYTGGVWKVDKVSTTSRKVPANIWNLN